MRAFSWIVLVIWIAAGCNEERPQGPLVFFDLKEFLTAEEDRLGGHFDVVKTVEVNGKPETIEYNAYSWESELDLLKQWDINRPAWHDQYQRDTISDGLRRHIRYRCIEKDLQVQSMEIWQNGKQVDSILIRTEVDNPLRTTHGIYLYKPEVGLEFSQLSSRRFGSKQDLSVTLLLSGPVD